MTTPTTLTTPTTPTIPPNPDSAIAIARDVRARTRTAHSITRESLDRLHAINPAINAFTQTFADTALAHAKWIDEQCAASHAAHLPLAGVPIAIKDNICIGPDATPSPTLPGIAGKTTCASRMLEHYKSPFTATAVSRLIRAGAIIIGKTNLDEFAMGSSGENSAFGVTRNPWNHAHVPGGSSSGSAAAVAARICPVALGSDTGGSIRQPAAFCGLVGLKPTYGRISRYGLVAYASSLDQIGPLTTNVADAALILEIINGQDLHDATSSSRAPFLASNVFESISANVITSSSPLHIGPFRIGVVRKAIDAANHPAVTQALHRTIAAFKARGDTIIDIDLPMLDAAIAAYYVVAPAEAASNLARFDGVRYGYRATLAPNEGLETMYARSRGQGFGPEVLRRIMLGTHVLSSGYYDAYYITASKARRAILNDFNAAFEGINTNFACDVILMPTTPGPAFAIGSKTTDPMAMYLEDIYTVAINLAGLPAINIPAGFTNYADQETQPLPVGVQLVGRAFDESRLLAVAHALESALNIKPPQLP